MGKASATSTKAITTQNELVDGAYLGISADLTGYADLSRAENAPVSEEQRNQCRANEERAVRFQNGEAADPGTAEAQGDQHQRPQAARGREDCRQTSSEECTAPISRFRHTFILPSG